MKETESQGRSDKTWSKDEAWYHDVMENSADAIFITDQEGDYQFVNKKACQLLKYTREELLQLNIEQVIPPQEKDYYWSLFEQTLTKGNNYLEVELLKKDGSLVPVDLNAVVLPDGSVYGSCRDISVRKQTEKELVRTHRALKTLSACNEIVIRAEDEDKLLADVCEVIVNKSGYNFAWVGYAEQHEEKIVRPVAQAGFDEGYLEQILVKWNESPRGLGPAGSAVRTQKPSVVKNIMEDPSFTPWREEAEKRGYRSVLSLPLTIEDRTFGVLSIYSGEPDAFDDEEFKLLKELSDDLAHGLHVLQIKRDRERSEREKEKLLEQIRERYKELNLLYAVARFGTNHDLAIAEILQQTVESIPPAWQYPGITEARITFEDENYMTNGFESTEWSMKAPIQGSDKQYGEVEVIYKKHKPPAYDGPFLREEHDLIETTGRLLGNIVQQKLMENRLEDERRLMRALIDNLPDAIYAKDKLGRKILANKADCENIGMSEEEVLGKTDRELFPDEVADKSMALDWKVLESGEPVYDREEELQNYKGDKFWVVTSKIPLRDSEGQVTGMVGIGKDITERLKYERELKKTLEEKQILLSEIHHRVKNNLAIISSLLYLQLDKTEDQRVRSILIDSQNRIHSIALIHEQLYQDAEKGASINMSEYLPRLIDSVENLTGSTKKEVKSRVEAHEISFPLSQAVPLGLLICELLMNAFKHAFEGREKGRILIRLQHKDGEIELEISDDGVGLPGKFDLAGGSMGMQIVRTLSNQLQGELEYDSVPGKGTTFRLTFRKDEDASFTSNYTGGN